jgi:hypothetical protein
LGILFKDITPQAISCHSGRAFDGFVGSTSITCDLPGCNGIEDRVYTREGPREAEFHTWKYPHIYNFLANFQADKLTI